MIKAAGKVVYRIHYDDQIHHTMGESPNIFNTLDEAERYVHNLNKDYWMAYQRGEPSVYYWIEGEEKK